MVSIGDKFPDIDIFTFNDEGPQKINTGSEVADKKIVLFAVPGAFTPTCHMTHLPGFVKNIDPIKAKGVDEVICVSANDAFVMKAWAEASDAMTAIKFWADGNAELAKALDLVLDGSGFGLGTRLSRFSMIVDKGVITALNVEDTPGTADVSGADAILQQL